MTPADLKAEFHYRYEERLALLDQFGTPTPEQHKIATDEANAAIAILSLSPVATIPLGCSSGEYAGMLAGDAVTRTEGI